MNKIQEIKYWLEKIGVQYSENSDIREQAVTFIHKTPSIKCRKVLVNSNINYANYKDIVHTIKNKIENGNCFYPHLSTRVLDISIPDQMLFEFDIIHIHLTNKKDRELSKRLKRKFYVRTGPLLYIRMLDNECYFLEVGEHGGWCNISLIDIIENNWPESIKNLRIQDVVEHIDDPRYSVDNLIDEFENEERGRKKLRKCGINSMVKTSTGNYYMPLGGGFTSDKKPLMVWMCKEKFSDDKIIKELINRLKWWNNK